MSLNLGQIAALWIEDFAPSNTSMIWDDTSITGGIRHKFYDKSIGDWVPFRSQINYRVDIDQSQSVVSIPDQNNIDYEIEIVIFRTDSGADGKDAVFVTGKTMNSFVLNLDPSIGSGVFIYRILNF